MTTSKFTLKILQTTKNQKTTKIFAKIMQVYKEMQKTCLFFVDSELWSLVSAQNALRLILVPNTKNNQRATSMETNIKINR